MTDDLLWHRIQFTFTMTYHYLFPQLTGLVTMPKQGSSVLRISTGKYVA